MANDLR